MPELFQYPFVPDHRGTEGPPNLATVRYVYRPAEKLMRAEQWVPVREPWMPVWSEGPEDVLQTKHPKGEPE